MDYAGGPQFDWDAYINKGLDIVGAKVTDQPYYVYNPNVATQTTTYPVYDNAGRQVYSGAGQYPQQQTGAAIQTSNSGFGFNLTWQTGLLLGVVAGAFLLGKKGR
jgi:hypothetical protein